MGQIVKYLMLFKHRSLKIIRLVYHVCTYFFKLLRLLDRAYMVVPVLRSLRIAS